ncbi:hypothetical protein ACSNOK_17065 [Streptomyces sp. URMC 126]|uniref:hypothetical protein n=1 Tax=Streptomyces sp. URMC 126 TaxID=3423401 RepID=UPI003F1B43F5
MWAHLKGAEEAAGAPGPVAVAGGVRLLGADALAPYVLTGQAVPPEESAAVELALAALPPARRPTAAPPGGPEGPWVRAWIDWGLATVLARLDPGRARIAVPMPQGPPPCDARASRHGTGIVTGTGTGPDDGRGDGWVRWSLRMASVASLALPGLDTPLHYAARANRLALARGAVRALLRGDFPTAARITRWLAWPAADGTTLPLDVRLLTEDIALRGGGERCLLDAECARRLLGPGGGSP